MKPLLFPIHAADSLLESLLASEEFEQGEVEHRRFPDGESYVRLATPVDDRAVVLLCGLERADERLMPLLLAADAAREQGAHQVGLIAPYLGYMRQDKAFRVGEAISARTFAAILSRHIDWLVTIEPHLHRIASLGEIFSVPARAAQATGPVGEWISAHADNPFLIGPDSESSQWVERIANRAGAPFAVLEKQRLGDRDVRITGSIEGLREGMTPVLVDDIISSGGTIAEAVERIALVASRPTMCIAIHALAEKLPQRLSGSAAFAQLVSCNSVPHSSNQIDIAAPLVAEARALIEPTSARHRL